MLKIYNLLFETSELNQKNNLVFAHIPNIKRIILINLDNIQKASDKSKNKTQFLRMFYTGVTDKYTESNVNDPAIQCILGQINYEKIVPMLYKINSVAAVKGFGTPLYEKVMEMVYSIDGGFITPSALIEKKALNIYKKFLNRNDIEKKPLIEINKLAAIVRKSKLSKQYPESDPDNKPFYLGFQKKSSTELKTFDEVLQGVNEKYNLTENEIDKIVSLWFDSRYSPEI